MQIHWLIEVDVFPETASRVLRDGPPPCILMPTDLSTEENDGSWDAKIQAAIRDAAKIQLTAPLLTWIISTT